MGIAGFFLWLQRWYGECIDDIPEEVVQAALCGDVCPDHVASKYRYDNLYIDMNGLIHPCCHDTHPLPEPQTETEMFQRIFEQLDLLVKVVRPRKCLVLCIDGVAPRSKMNQQRSRRFRAAEERIESDSITEECAHKLVSKYHLPRPHINKKWDHNVITPSTVFMERIGLAVEWFVLKKLNEDAAWRRLCVVFSDAHVPGEGEHKIMQYIRGLRVQPGYHHRTTHVIHGMDADLVCLGLSTHEPHVSILRNQLNDTYGPDYNRFCYFNLYSYRLHLMRDFGNIANMEFERVIDDFVFLCFFVGNDFLPHVPLISIKTKGIELLLDHYVRDFGVHSYLTHGGDVNFSRLHKFLQHFMQEKVDDLRKEYHGVLRGKERAKVNVNERVATMEKELENLLSSLPHTLHRDERQEVSNKALSLMTSCIKERTRLVADQQPMPFSYLDNDYRDNYYTHKFGWDCGNRAEFEHRITTCCGEYFRGMQWVMWYYTKGCPSWEWYYPYHYAPLLQDLARFDNEVNIEMTMSSPLHPIEQLLAVLPRLSVHALPEALHDAVKDPHSPLGSFYPDSVDVDVSEANFSYQGVLRIPFIDSRQLHSACNELVELEEDVGTTLLFCHHSNPLRTKLEHLLTSATSMNSSKKNKHKADLCHASKQERQTHPVEVLLSHGELETMVPITQPIATSVPIAGHIGRYEAAWPLHARLDCPDSGIAQKTSFGSFIAHNAVHMYRYELNTQALYRQELLTNRKRSRSTQQSITENEQESRSTRHMRQNDNSHTSEKWQDHDELHANTVVVVPSFNATHSENTNQSKKHLGNIGDKSFSVSRQLHSQKQKKRKREVNNKFDRNEADENSVTTATTTTTFTTNTNTFDSHAENLQNTLKHVSKNKLNNTTNLCASDDDNNNNNNNGKCYHNSIEGYATKEGTANTHFVKKRSAHTKSDKNWSRHKRFRSDNVNYKLNDSNMTALENVKRISQIDDMISIVDNISTSHNKHKRAAKDNQQKKNMYKERHSNQIQRMHTNDRHSRHTQKRV